MNDLHTINQLNAQAVSDKIPAWRADGKWVISEYSGLHFIGAHPYDTEGQARSQLEHLETHKTPDQRYQLLEPTAVPGATIEGEIKAIELLGADRSYAFVQFCDFEVPLVDLVTAAQSASGLSAVTWNALAADERDALIDGTIDHVREEAPASLARFENAKRIPGTPGTQQQQTAGDSDAGGDESEEVAA